MGSIASGFDFLGYHLPPGTLTPARRTLQNLLQRIARLYEQGADENRIGQYVRNWLVWPHSGLGTLGTSVRLVAWADLSFVIGPGIFPGAALSRPLCVSSGLCR